MEKGTCTVSTCTTGTLDPGTCTGNTFVYSAAAGDVGWDCVTDEGTTASTKTRDATCKTLAGTDAGGDAFCAATKPTDLSNTCAAVPFTCANGGGSVGTAFDCSSEVTNTAVKAGGTACAADGTACNAAACCEAPTCDAYTCTAGVKKASPATISGADDTTCCDGE